MRVRCSPDYALGVPNEESASIAAEEALPAPLSLLQWGPTCLTGTPPSKQAVLSGVTHAY